MRVEAGKTSEAHSPTADDDVVVAVAVPAVAAEETIAACSTAVDAAEK